MSRKNALLGGPGLSGYAHNADVFCVTCGQERIKHAPQEFFSDSRQLDSDHVPQPIFFGEHEVAQHCGECGEYLYGGDGE